MNRLLPVGVAIFNRSKDSGFINLFNVLKKEKNIYDTLYKEGSDSARTIRDNLDNIIPGLGNPIVSVDVEAQSNNQENLDNQSLCELITRVNKNLSKVDKVYENGK